MESLLKEPWRFDFFQAVRLLQLHAALRKTPDSPVDFVGYDGQANREIVRFRALPSLQFPAAEITACSSLISATHDGGAAAGADVAQVLESPEWRCELTVPFLGMFGPNGVLPRHYTQLIIDRGRQKDSSLRDFLDLFHHRLLSLFHRAWDKYRFYVAFERNSADSSRGGEDVFTSCLFCVLGLGTKHLRNRLDIPDHAFLYYAAHFSQHPPNAISLRDLVSDYFNEACEVIQFQGQWLYLNRDDQSRASCRDAAPANNRLGMDTVLGEKVWSSENKFRVRLGPLTYSSFQRYMPQGDLLRPLSQLVRAYVGPEYDFDVQLSLIAADVPASRLGGHASGGSCLGWNTWLISRQPANDRSDACFCVEADPSRTA